MKEFLEEILKCPICKCQIKDPRILPCYHSFCLNCLRQHIENGLQSCAICQEKVPLPVNNVWGFPKNEVLHKILNFINPSNGKLFSNEIKAVLINKIFELQYHLLEEKVMHSIIKFLEATMKSS